MKRPHTKWLLDAPTSATNPKADTPIYPFLAQLVRGEDLSMEQAADFFRVLLNADTSPQQIAGALTALTAKCETFSELAGMAQVMRENAVPVKTRYTNFIDTAGTGASEAKTFNVSTAAAFVVAGAGLPVAKQVSRAVTSQTGSAEVLAKLGVKVSDAPEIAQTCLNGAGIAFMFAPKFHPTLKRVGTICSNLGIRSCFNLLGVLSNPAMPPKQLVGVWHQSLVEPTARVLMMLGTKNAWVVHGKDGLDEMSLAGETLIAEIFDDNIRKFIITPQDFGLRQAATNHLKADTPEASAEIIREVLGSKRRDEARQLVIINAAAALLVGGLAENPLHAARLAEQSLDSHAAQVKLERLIETTNRK
ncbi:MAG: anthranilate phosphoribosyltransferase [Acidobacteriota bacterium]|nr:anthranilate phosphoribosyltransferase [Acidobacteriota bacterium]